MKIRFLFVFVLLILSCKEQSTLPDNSLPPDGNSYSLLAKQLILAAEKLKNHKYSFEYLYFSDSEFVKIQNLLEKISKEAKSGDFIPEKSSDFKLFGGILQKGIVRLAKEWGIKKEFAAFALFTTFMNFDKVLANSCSGYSNVLDLESMPDQKFEEHIKNIKSSSCDFKEEVRGQQHVQGTLVNNFLSGVGGNPSSFSSNSGNCYQQALQKYQEYLDNIRSVCDELSDDSGEEGDDEEDQEEGNSNDDDQQDGEGEEDEQDEDETEENEDGDENQENEEEEDDGTGETVWQIAKNSVIIGVMLIGVISSPTTGGASLFLAESAILVLGYAGDQYFSGNNKCFLYGTSNGLILNYNIENFSTGFDKADKLPPNVLDLYNDCMCNSTRARIGSLFTCYTQEDQTRINCMLNPFGPDGAPRKECQEALSSDTEEMARANPKCKVIQCPRNATLTTFEDKCGCLPNMIILENFPNNGGCAKINCGEGAFCNCSTATNCRCSTELGIQEIRGLNWILPQGLNSSQIERLIGSGRSAGQ